MKRTRHRGVKAGVSQRPAAGLEEARHGGHWAVTAQLSPDTPLLGEIHAEHSPTPDPAVETTRHWIENYCSSAGLKLTDSEKLNHYYQHEPCPQPRQLSSPTSLSTRLVRRRCGPPGRRVGGAQGTLHATGRHTAGTILNELGVDMPTIMEILRHTQISQTRRYVKGRSHLSKDAMRCMGDHFMPASEPATETTTETSDRNEKAQLRHCLGWASERAAFGIRTRDLRITSALLWPSELRRRAVRTMVRSATSVSLHSFRGCSEPARGAGVEGRLGGL